jgi:hypothetical protein
MEDAKHTPRPCPFSERPLSSDTFVGAHKLNRLLVLPSLRKKYYPSWLHIPLASSVVQNTPNTPSVMEPLNSAIPNGPKLAGGEDHAMQMCRFYCIISNFLLLSSLLWQCYVVDPLPPSPQKMGVGKMGWNDVSIVSSLSILKSVNCST